MDLLSRLLRLYPVDVALDHVCKLGAPWALENPPTDYGVAPYHIVTSGSVWLYTAGFDPQHLHCGDVIVFPAGAAHTLKADVDSPPSAVRLETDSVMPQVVNDEKGAKSEILCGYFHFEPGIAGPLFASLPGLMVIREAGDKNLQGMQALIAILGDEHRAPGQGSEVILSQLASALFAMILRAWMSQAQTQPSMLALLSDARLLRCLNAMLEDPARQWSVEELADTCHLSRATFARHFVKVAGMTPGDMLMRIRMAKAAHWLRRDARSVAIIADIVGYQSEAAFSRAFSRFHGTSPGAFRREKQETKALSL